MAGFSFSGVVTRVFHEEKEFIGNNSPILTIMKLDKLRVTFTVPTAQAARKSVIIAMFIIGGFYVLTTLLGFGAAINLTPQGIISVDPGGNMATLMLAQQLGADIAPILGDLFLAFLCSVAFATILAVVSGLVLAASAAIAHDIYVNVIKDGHADQHEQVMAARITSLVVGAVGIVIGLLAEKANVAHLVALAFAVASSGNLPVVVLSLFWRKFNTAGVISGLVVGTVASIGLVMVSPNMTYPKVVAAGAQKIITAMEKKQSSLLPGAQLEEKDSKALAKAKVDFEMNKDGKSIMGLDKPILTLKNPGIISIPLGFLAAIFGALLFPNKRSEEMFDEVYVRQNTGLGMAKAIEAGLPKMRIEEAAARTQARIDSGRQPLIGVNKYQVSDDHPPEVLKIDNGSVRDQQIAKLTQLRGERDQGDFTVFPIGQPAGGKDAALSPG